MTLYEGEVVKRGTFLYDGTVTCDLRIVRRQVRPGVDSCRTLDGTDRPEADLAERLATFPAHSYDAHRRDLHVAAHAK